MKQFKRRPLSGAISLAIAGTALAATLILPAYADEGSLEEVTVTATKRTENLQDVPISIQVLANKELEELGIKGFSDYITWLPTVSYQSAGPGYGIVYMRGIASGGDGNHSGSQPSVGMYLDEQPITTINQILNVHVYDVARIETLAGPQGTLFGQGSQAGTIRIITNKPEIGRSEGGYDFYANSIAHGDPGYGIEGFINIPINDRMAVRLVAWHEYQGGYIDNVYAERHYATSLISVNNADLVEANFNTAETTGMRALLKIDLTDDWTLTPGIQYQKGKTTGVWYDNPKYVGEYEVARFSPDKQSEDWYQATLTLDGQIGDLNLVYAGAYMDRNVDAQYDYSGYADYLEYTYSLPQYYDDGSIYYLDCTYYQADGSCANPTQYVVETDEFTRFSNELRLQSSQDQRLRWIAGLFYQRQEHFYDLQYTVDEVTPAKWVVEDRPVVWQTNQKRVDKDYAIFGEAYFDITDNWTLIGGVRAFWYDNSLYGFNGQIRYCTGYYDENGDFVEAPAGEGGVPQYPCYNTGILDSTVKGHHTAWKGSTEYRIDGDKMVYATYSEGFRAGGANRARIPGLESYEPDWVYNYEFGWKTTWADGQFRFNGALYIEDWDNFQYGFLDFANYGPLTIYQNVGNSRTKGFEWQMEWAPTGSFSLSFQGSYNDAKLRTDFWRIPSEKEAGLPPTAPAGTEMPFVPPLQMTSIARYNFTMGELASFAQVAVSYRASTWTSLDHEVRADPDIGGKIPAYTVLNLSAGFERDNWSLMFYMNNATDKRGLTDILNPGYVDPAGFDYNQVIIQPRNIGIRWTQRFNGGYEEASSPPPAPPPPPPAAPPPNPDLDGDGVLNARDKCPNTRAGAVVDLDGCEVEAVISLEGVHFGFNEATLTPEAMAILDKAAGLLEKQEKVVVEVAGHTDSVGSEEYNQKLSERRAVAVKDYLESKGIKATRLTAMGYGEAQPVASNDTDAGRALNRRVELIVLSR